MGGPTSHLKQIKGLVRKAHLALPLDDPKIQEISINDAIDTYKTLDKAYDLEHIPPCDREECRKSNDGLWCAFHIAYPPRNWQRAFNARGKTMTEVDVQRSWKRRVRQFVLPEDLVIYQPGSRKRTEQGLAKLMDTMVDNVLAIDMQWNSPDRKVGLLQVASSTFSLLIRGPKYWDYGLPPLLQDIFRKPGSVTLGFNFDRDDQEMLYRSFGWSTEEFSNFIDVQALAAKCGYPADIDLRTLARKILGVKLHLEPSFEETDWEAERLSGTESLYASLSVFAISQVFRQLRYWHALPRRCATCNQELGKFGISEMMLCIAKDCNMQFSSIKEHQDHCITTGHAYQTQLCPACHRVNPLDLQIKLENDGFRNLQTKKVPRGSERGFLHMTFDV